MDQLKTGDSSGVMVATGTLVEMRGISPSTELVCNSRVCGSGKLSVEDANENGTRDVVARTHHAGFGIPLLREVLLEEHGEPYAVSA